MLLRVFVDDGFPLFITTQDDNSTTCTYLQPLHIDAHGQQCFQRKSVMEQ